LEQQFKLMLMMPRLQLGELLHLCPVMSNCCHDCGFKGGASKKDSIMLVMLLHLL